MRLSRRRGQRRQNNKVDPVTKKGWYFKETSSGSYYSPFAERKNIYHLVGPGDRDPTPLEIWQMICAYPESSLEIGGKLICEYDARLASAASVELPTGVYTHSASSMMGNPPERLIPTSLRADRYLKMPLIYDPLAEEIKAFLTNESLFRELGAIYKRGFLLYGPPGEGKTSLIRCLMKNEVPEDAVVIFMENMPSNEFITCIRETLKDRLKVFVFEELVNIIESGRIERVLDFLDGEKSLDRSIIIGTTNYPERLPANIVDRPSRFDKLYKIGDPGDQERRILLDHFLRRSAKDEEVSDTRGLSTAAIKELCLLTVLRRMTVAEGVKALKDHHELVKREFAEPKHLGIVSDDFD